MLREHGQISGNTLRIVHVIDRLDPMAGGPTTVVLGMCPPLVKMGWEVAVVCLEVAGRQEAILNNLRAAPGMEAVDVRFLPRPSFTQQLLGRELMDAVAPHLRRTDVVHLHGTWDTVLWSASRVARQAGIPYCLTPHGMLDPWSLHHRSWKKKAALLWRYRKMLNQAAVLHATSPIEAQGLAQLGLRPPVRVIPLGLTEADVTPPAAGTFYDRFPQLERHPYILFLGRLHFKKGLDYLAEIFDLVARQDPELRLVLVGPDGGALDPLMQRLMQAGLSQRVFVLGPLWGADKQAALRDAFCFCLPSRQENFGMVVLEAMWAGTPVAISDQVQLCTEVSAAQAGVVLPLEPAAFARAILDLRRDPARRQAMGQRGQALVRERFRWDAVVREFDQAYRGILAPADKPTGPT